MVKKKVKTRIKSMSYDAAELKKKWSTFPHVKLAKKLEKQKWPSGFKIKIHRE